VRRAVGGGYDDLRGPGRGPGACRSDPASDEGCPVKRYELVAGDRRIADAHDTASYLEGGAREITDAHVLRIWEDGLPSADEYVIDLVVDEDTDGADAPSLGSLVLPWARRRWSRAQLVPPGRSVAVSSAWRCARTSGDRSS